MVFNRVLMILFLFTSFFCFSQKEKVVKEVSFIGGIEQAPIFPGCETLKTEFDRRKCLQKGIKAHVAMHFNMDLANELNLVPGKKRIIGIFKIDKKGDVTNITAKAPHPKLKEEAIRMMKKLPKMIPGKQRGIPVSMKYAIPIFVYVKTKNIMDKKIVIAHRGASGYLPEHTMEAKAMAYAMKPDYIEQDLVLSKDNVPIVIHDIYLDDVTNVAIKFPKKKRADDRFYVIDFTFEELQTLQVTERFDPVTGKQFYPNRFQKNKANFKLHSLQQEIELIQGLNKSTGNTIGIYPEIKAPEFHNKNKKDISSIVLSILSEYGYKTKKDKCILQCFDSRELERIRKELGSQLFLVQLIEFEKEAKNLKHFATYADGIGPWYTQIIDKKIKGKWQFTSLIEEAHDLKMVVHPYTFRADQLSEFKSFDEQLQVILFEAGADGCFTDFTDKVVEFLSKK